MHKSLIAILILDRIRLLSQAFYINNKTTWRDGDSNRNVNTQL